MRSTVRPTNSRASHVPRVSARCRRTRPMRAPANWKQFCTDAPRLSRRQADMWGIIPAAGKGSRIQPLAFSKELLPVSGRIEGDVRRPRAVSDYLMERLVIGGADRICIVISPGKSDILEYYGGPAYGANICYA